MLLTNCARQLAGNKCCQKQPLVREQPLCYRKNGTGLVHTQANILLHASPARMEFVLCGWFLRPLPSAAILLYTPSLDKYAHFDS